MALIDELKKYAALIRQLRVNSESVWKCFEEYISVHGVVYTSQALLPFEQDILFNAVDRYRGRFKPRQCFYNAAMLMSHDVTRTIRYCEGYTVINGIAWPIHHAWAVLNGKVIDLTLRLDKPVGNGRLPDRIIGTFPSDWEYVGVTFKNVDVIERMLTTRAAGSLLNYMERDFPVMFGKMKCIEELQKEKADGHEVPSVPG